MRINTLVGNMPDSSGSIIKGIREIRERGTDQVNEIGDRWTI